MGWAEGAAISSWVSIQYAKGMRAWVLQIDDLNPKILGFRRFSFF